MKKVAVIFACLLFSLNVYAQESENSKRSMSDLMYFPEEGTTFMSLSLAYWEAESVCNYHYNGSKYKYSDIEQNLTPVEIQAGYAFTNNLTLALSADYLFGGKDKQTYGEASIYEGTTDTYESEGFGDPGLTAGYRIIEEHDFPVTIDAYLSFSPELIDAELSSTSEKGNYGRGGYELSGRVDFGKKFDTYSLMASIGYNYYGDKEYKDLDDDSQVEENGGNLLVFGLHFRYFPGSELYVDLGLNLEFEEEIKGRDPVSSVKYKYDSNHSTDLTLELGWSVIPESLLLSCGFTYGINSDIDLEMEYGNYGYDYSYEDYSYYGFVFRAKKEF